MNNFEVSFDRSCESSQDEYECAHKTCQDEYECAFQLALHAMAESFGGETLWGVEGRACSQYYVPKNKPLVASEWKKFEDTIRGFFGDEDDVSSGSFSFKADGQWVYLFHNQRWMKYATLFKPSPVLEGVVLFITNCLCSSIWPEQDYGLKQWADYLIDLEPAQLERVATITRQLALSFDFFLDESDIIDFIVGVLDSDADADALSIAISLATDSRSLWDLLDATEFLIK